jgi:hypothetical protein
MTVVKRVCFGLGGGLAAILALSPAALAGPIVDPHIVQAPETEGQRVGRGLCGPGELATGANGNSVRYHSEPIVRNGVPVGWKSDLARGTTPSPVCIPQTQIPGTTVKSRHGEGEFTVSCGPGMSAMGGGASVDNFDDQRVARSEPTFTSEGRPTGWKVNFQVADPRLAGRTGSVYAICTPRQEVPGLRVFSAHARDGDLRVRCPDAAQATGAGGGLDQPSAFGRQGITWIYVRAAATDTHPDGAVANSFSNSLTAYVICNTAPFPEPPGALTLTTVGQSGAGPAEAYCGENQEAVGGGGGIEDRSLHRIAPLLSNTGSPIGWQSVSQGNSGHAADVICGTVEHTYVALNTGAGEFAASCDVGDVALGGGVAASEDGARIVRSEPVKNSAGVPTGWKGSIVKGNPGTAAGGTVYAICGLASVVGPIRVHDRYHPSWERTSADECPGYGRMTGAGAGLDGPGFDNALNEIRLGGDPPHPTAPDTVRTSISGTSGYTSYLICLGG